MSRVELEMMKVELESLDCAVDLLTFGRKRDPILKVVDYKVTFLVIIKSK